MIGKFFSIIFSKIAIPLMFAATLVTSSTAPGYFPPNLWFLRPAPFVWLCLAVLYQVIFAIPKRRFVFFLPVSLITGAASFGLTTFDWYQNLPFSQHVFNFVVVATITFTVAAAGMVLRLAGEFLISKIKPLLPRKRIYLPNLVTPFKLLGIFILVWFVTGLQINIKNLTSRLENIERRFGGAGQLRCSESDLEVLLRQRVVRVIGGFGEGSGFPISQSEILTNFHVIDGEPVPKVVFPDGAVASPIAVSGTRSQDLAVLKLNVPLSPLPIYDPQTTPLVFGEPVYAAGFPLGSELPGEVTINKGSFVKDRLSRVYGMNIIQTDISVAPGASGGPLVTACGEVVGLTTSGVAGLSLFFEINDVLREISHASSEEIAPIEIDTSTPEGIVRAFYTFIKTGDLEGAYNLLSDKRKTVDFEEWKQGYSHTLQVDLISAKPDETDNRKVWVKIMSKDLVDGEMVKKYFDGWWMTEHTVSDSDRQTDWESDRILLAESNIKEVPAPGWLWFYEEMLDKLK